MKRPVYPWASHEGVWRSVIRAPLTLNLDTQGKLLASRNVHFIP